MGLLIRMDVTRTKQLIRRRWVLTLVFFAFFASAESQEANRKDSLRNSLLSHSQDTSVIKHWIDLSQVYWDYDLDTSIWAAEQALEISTSADLKSGIAISNRFIGLAHFFKGEYEGAQEHWTASLENYKAINDQSNMARLYTNIGAVYHEKNVHKAALENYMAAVEIAERVGDKNRQMAVYQNIAAIYGTKNAQHADAIEYYTKALDVGESIDDSYTKGTISANLAEIYIVKDLQLMTGIDTVLFIGHVQKRSEIVEDSLKAIFKRQGKKEILNNTFDSHTAWSKYVDTRSIALRSQLNEDLLGMEKFRQSIVYFNSADARPADISYSLRGLGKIFKDWQQFDSAYYYTLKGIDLISDSTGSPLDNCESRMMYADILEEHGRLLMKNRKTYRKGRSKLKEAIVNYEAAIDISIPNKFVNQTRLGYDGLKGCHQKLKDFQQAYFYQKKELAYHDSVYNFDHDRDLNGLIFESNLKIEQERTLAEQERAERQEAEASRQKLQKNASLIGLGLILAIAFILMKMYRDKVQTNKILDEQKDQIETLLLNTLPADVVKELEETGVAKPKEYEQVSVLFTDFKGFTKLAADLSPTELVDELTIFFTAFDDIMGKYGIEKIKTIGDAYMCAGGIPNPDPDHPRKIILAGLEIQAYMGVINEKRATLNLPAWELRVGIHTGPVVAGVVGKKKYAYDIWGSTVNTASRMESNGEAGRVNISTSTYDLIKDDFPCSHRGKIWAKNIGDIDMYFVDHELSIDTLEEHQEVELA